MSHVIAFHSIDLRKLPRNVFLAVTLFLVQQTAKYSSLCVYLPPDFCEETCSALRVHPSLQDVTGTVIFIQEILDLWKIINVRTKNKDIRHNNPLESEIKSTDDPRLTKLN